MEQEEFSRLIVKICRYWERRVPKEEEALEWFEQVKWIPEGYGDRIYRGFTRMHTRPINIPWHIKDVYKGLSGNTEKKTDFLTELIVKNAKKYNMTYLEALYDLCHPIRIKEIDIGPALRFLKAEGFTVDLAKLHKKACSCNFCQEMEAMVNGVAKLPPQRTESEYGDEVPF
jgi:hypothetical protein